jgi:hypothetical protein
VPARLRRSTDTVSSPVIVTPATAQTWLARRVHNQCPDAARVAAFADLMKNGGWRIDLADPRQPVVLRGSFTDLVLEDGLHRLTAIGVVNTIAEMYVDAPADLVILSPRGRFLFPVSPARAAAWLGNARPGRAKALAYAVIMAAGNWRAVPKDPVRLTPTLDVVEGQHRLLGVVLSDETVPLWVDWQ